MKKVTMVVTVTDEEATELLRLRAIPMLPNICCHLVHSVEAEPVDKPFGVQVWNPEYSDPQASSVHWSDTYEQAKRTADKALADGKSVRFLPIREVGVDATALA